MKKQPPIFTIEELDGDRFPDLAAAQQHARHALVIDLITTLQELLASGVLIRKDGRIIPNPDQECD